MNTVVETINAAGRAFVDFALPMLMQSSVLILILLAVDAILRRRVRAVFRYWIWVLVLVKLVLPPSLGSPVSVGTWFGDTLEVPTTTLFEPEPPPAVEPEALQPHPTISAILAPPAPEIVRPVVPPISPAPAEEVRPVVPQTKVVVPPPVVSLNWQGLALLVWSAVVIVLTLLLAQRAFFVHGLVGQAGEANPAVVRELGECRRRLGLRRRVNLRLSPNATSPAVCGLFRPVVLIPQSLAPRLHSHDLQAVLLHELAHVKRGDLWINLAQTLLQIAYFYNPLLWLANAVIRRTREQAVDEAVLVAMGETAQQYPETLVNIARLAFTRRPTLSLRLIGVVESKSALTSRIKHILNRPLPKTARLGLIGATAVLITAAVLLPMARGVEGSASVDNRGPLDIRLTGVRPDGGDELYDADGRKLDVPMSFLGGDSGPWKDEEQHRDFILQTPELDEQLLFLPVWVRAAGTGTTVGGGSILFGRVEDLSTPILSATFDREYRTSRTPFLVPKKAVARVDLPLRYFYGGRRESLCTFTGPFVPDRTVQAEQGRPFQLTPEPMESWDGTQLKFHLSTEQVFESSMSVLAYDKQGRRYLLDAGSGYNKYRGVDRGYIANAVPWDQIAVVTVGEKPHEITFRNVAVRYPDRPPRTHAAYLDIAARTLGLTGRTPEQLRQYQVKSPQEAIAVLDVVRGDWYIRTTFEALKYARPPVKVSGLDQAAQQRIHQVAARWAGSGLVSHYGIQLGLMGRWPEFFDLAMDRLGRDHRLDHLHHHYERMWLSTNHDIARALAMYWTELSGPQVERLKRFILGTHDGRLLKDLFVCLRNTKSQTAIDALWELAQDDRPWIWWEALDAWHARTARTRSGYDDLPERIQVRLSLVRGISGGGPLEAETSTLLTQMFTPEMGVTDSNAWNKVRERIMREFDRETITRLYIEYLRQMQSAMTPRQWLVDDAARHDSGWMTAYVIRTLNVWYGVNIGRLGTDESARSSLMGPKTFLEFQGLIAEALEWHRANRGAAPLDLAFEGRVVDSAGRPVPMAELSLTPWERDGDGYRNRPDAKALRYRVDAAGEFGIRNLENTHHTFSVTAEGFGTREDLSIIQLPDGRFRISGQADNVIVMEKPASLSGRVIGPDGLPLADAIVQVGSHPTHGIRGPGRARTDAQGRFTIGPLASGHHIVRYLEGTLPAGIARGEISRAFQLVRMEEGVSVEDVVLDLRESICSLEFELVDRNDRPISSDLVTLEIPLAPGDRRSVPIAAMTIVEPKTLYRLDHLPPMDGSLRVHVQGDAPQSVNMQLRPNETARARIRFDGIASDSATPATPESARNASSSNVMAKLPNGVTVELLGIRDCSSELWWAADGEALSATPYAGPAAVRSMKAQMIYEVAFRIHSTVGKAFAEIEWADSATPRHGSLRPIGDTAWTRTDIPRDMEDVFRAIIHPGSEAGTVRIDVGVGLENAWELLGALDGRAPDAAVTLPDAVISPASEEGGLTIVTVSHRISGREIRLVAVDKNGFVHKPRGTTVRRGDGTGSYEARFELPLAEIQWVRLETQKLAWVAFKNVSLRPGLKTDVRIDTGSKSLADASTREVILPAADRRPMVLDLLRGELIPMPQQPGLLPRYVQQALRQMGKGDILYDVDLGDRTLIFLRDATSDPAGEETGEPSVTGHLISQQLPETLTVTTAEGRRYEVTILAADEESCTLTYSPLPLDRGAGGGAPVESEKAGGSSAPIPEDGRPAGGGLEFRVAATRGNLDSAAIEGYRRALVQGDNPPEADFAWFPVRTSLTGVPQAIVQEHAGKTYVLLWNKRPYVVLPSQDWGLENVYRTSDAVGKPAVGLTLNAPGAALLREVMAAGVGQSLAIVVDGTVVSMPHIAWPLAGASALITGNFTEQEIDELVRALREPAATPDAAAGWQDIGKPIPADANDARTLAPGVVLAGIGQDVEGKMFVSMLRDVAATGGRQYRFRVHRKDGQVLEPQYYVATDRDGGRLWEKFIFDMWYHDREIDHFRLQSRRAGRGQHLDIPVARDEIAAATAGDGSLPGKDGPPGRYALSFDGRDDYLFVPDSESLRMPPSLTVEMWIKPQFPEGPYTHRPAWAVLARGAYTGTGRVQVQGFGMHMANFDPNENMVQFDRCEAVDRAISGASTLMRLPPDWLHLSETFRNREHAAAPGHPLVVGRYLIPTDDYLYGQIAEIRVWDFAKAGDIRRYEGKALTGAEPGLVACWTFEEGRGQIAHDLSPNANHARLGKSVEADSADPAWINLRATQSLPDEISGQVLDPEGKPVAGAQVALCTEEQGVTITPPRLVATDFRGKTSAIVETDTQGLFSFPAVSGEFVIFAAHETGFVRSAGTDSLSAPSLRLERWGRVEGTLRIGRKPGVDQTVKVLVDLGGGAVPWPWVRYEQETRTQDGGRFRFPQVAPVWVRLGHYAWMPDGKRESDRGSISQGGSTNERPICIRPGETLQVAIGGTGRPVIGRLILPAGHNRDNGQAWAMRMLATVTPDIPKPAGYDQMSPAQRLQWLGEWDRTPAGRAYRLTVLHDPNRRRYYFPIDANDSFRIEDVIPGRYMLQVWFWEGSEPPAPAKPIGPFGAAVEVPPMAEAYTEEPLDLGNLSLEMYEVGHAGLAWRRTDRYVPPDPNSFFPDDPEAGKRLDKLFTAADKNDRPADEILSTVRRGLRRTTQDRTLILAWIGNRYIWNATHQHPDAVEIMYHAVPMERHSAVYFGLSVVRDKSEAVVTRLVDLALADQEQNFYGRIVWGLNGPMRADRQLVERVLNTALENAGTESERAAVRRLYKDVLEQDMPPAQGVSGQAAGPDDSRVTLTLGGDAPLGLFYNPYGLWFEVRNRGTDEIEINANPVDQDESHRGEWGYVEVLTEDGEPLTYVWHGAPEMRTIPSRKNYQGNAVNGMPLRKAGPGVYKARLTLRVRNVRTNESTFMPSNWHTFRVTPAGRWPRKAPPLYVELREAEAYAATCDDGHGSREDAMQRLLTLAEKYPNTKYALAAYFLAANQAGALAHETGDASYQAKQREYYREIMRRWPDVVNYDTIYARLHACFGTSEAEFLQSRRDTYQWLLSLTEEQKIASIRGYAVLPWGEATDEDVERILPSLNKSISLTKKSLEESSAGLGADNLKPDGVQAKGERS